MKRTNAILLAAAACMPFASCSQKEAAPAAGKAQERTADDAPSENPFIASPQKPPVATPPQKGPSQTILSRSDLSKQYGKSFGERTWDVSRADVSAAVEHVRSYLEELRETTSSEKKREAIDSILARPDDYYACQAYGNVRYGEKMITLNYFPKRDILTLKKQGTDWQHLLTNASDGGVDCWEIHCYDDSTVFSGFATAKMLRENSKGPERRCAVLGKNDLSNENSDVGFERVWRPTPSQVNQVIRGIRPYLEKLKTTTSRTWQPEQIGEVLVKWDKYICQVVGYTEGEKKRIHLNFLPEDEIDGYFDREGLDWRHYYLRVCDGGSDYWRIEYDCETGTYLYFECNGEA
jgi:hypothetical protein